MALPAVAAGVAKGVKAAGKELKKVGKRVGKEARKRPPDRRSPQAAPVREEAPEDETTRKISALVSPEGVAMISIAGILDLVGVICLVLDIFFGVGEILSWLSDGIGIIFIGGWMFFRSGKVVGAPKRTKGGLFSLDFLKTIFRGKYKKFLTPIIGEVLPFVGALPFWSLAVYFELTD